MGRTLLLFVGSVLAMAVTGPAVADEAMKPAACMVPGYKSLYVAGPGLYVGGEQDAAELERVKGFGVRHIIDLREADVDNAVPEAQIAQAFGLSYRRIAIRGAGDLTREKADELNAAIAAAKGEPVLVHCATGNRAAALLALRAGWIEGKPLDESLSFSERSGLSKLSPQVRSLLAPPGS